MNGNNGRVRHPWKAYIFTFIWMISLMAAAMAALTADLSPATELIISWGLFVSFLFPVFILGELLNGELGQRPGVPMEDTEE